LNYLIWPNVVSHQVAKAKNLVGLAFVYILKKVFKRGQVGVNIREKCDGHFIEVS
jgi:hypothetical protein